MAGGIIELATYGAEDIFLTGNPQITFFKTIYRRYTNFSCESVYQPFTGNAEFGGNLNCRLDKLGDLIYHTTLVIDLPKVNLIKSCEDLPPSNKHERQAIQDFYQLLNSYFAITTQKVRDLVSMLSVNNISYVSILNTINNPIWRLPIEKSYDTVLAWIAFDPRFAYFGLNRWDTMENFKITNLLKQLANIINFQTLKYANLPQDEFDFVIKQYLNNFLKQNYYSLLQEFQTAFAIIYYQTTPKEERYPFAWVERIGQSIVEQIVFLLGAEVIDRQTSDFLILWSDLTVIPPQKENFDKMIGQVPELILFDEKEKPEYQLLVPLYFYFNRHRGLALPVIALRYDDININLRLRKFSEVAYADVPWSENLEEIQDFYQIQILNVNLLVEYVFLDRPERIRFAQSTHEYLIETTQYNIIRPSGPNPFVRLDFNNPSKFMAWFAQPESYRHNFDGRTKCQWNNFGILPDGNGQSLDSCWIRINSLDRTSNTQDSKYFNWVQPYQCFLASPPDGLYVYSFALNPVSHQPSSTCNFSRLNQVGLYLNFSKAILSYREPIYFACYIMSYNILRVMGGRGCLAYQQSL